MSPVGDALEVCSFVISPSGWKRQGERSCRNEFPLHNSKSIGAGKFEDIWRAVFHGPDFDANRLIEFEILLSCSYYIRKCTPAPSIQCSCQTPRLWVFTTMQHNVNPDSLISATSAGDCRTSTPVRDRKTELHAQPHLTVAALTPRPDRAIAQRWGLELRSPTSRT